MRITRKLHRIADAVKVKLLAERARLKWGKSAPERQSFYGAKAADLTKSVIASDEVLVMLLADGRFFQVDDDSHQRTIVGCRLEDFAWLLEQTMRACSRWGLRIGVERTHDLWFPVHERALLQALAHRSVIRLTLTDRRGLCVERMRLEGWSLHEEHWVPPVNNRVATSVEAQAFEEKVLNAAPPKRLTNLIGGPPDCAPLFDVDVVYTWVNHLDEGWRALYEEECGERPRTDADGLARFLNRNELRASIRSVAEFAPWVRTIHIVSNCAAPSWLKQDHPQIHWVSHEAILPDGSLPTFNSHAIESRLHHVPELANEFIYMNDDFLFCAPASKNDFFEVNRICKTKLESWGRVHGEPRSGDPDYLNAARNGQLLLAQSFGVYPTRLHRHAPYALRRDVLLEMEERFPEAFKRTGASKFRATTDYSFVSFFFHHYALLTGRGRPCRRTTLLVQDRNPYHRRFERLLASRVNSKIRAPLTVCINDGGESHGNEDWNEAVLDFLNQMYPHKSVFES